MAISFDASSFDPFAPDTNEYSPEKVYARCEDSRGHSSTVRWGTGRGDVISVPKHVVAQMAALKECFPMLRTNVDIMRDALVHYLHMRAEQCKGQLPPEWHARLDRITQSAALEELQAVKREHDLILELIEERLREAKSKEELYVTVEISERAALSLTYPDYIRRAGEIIDRFRL